MNIQIKASNEGVPRVLRETNKKLTACTKEAGKQQNAKRQENMSLSGKILFSALILLVEFLKALIATLPTIITHTKLANCDENQQRKLSHMLVSFSFVNLAVVAGIFVFALYVLDSHGPYPQLNPVKIFANLSGIALILGSLLLIKNRLESTDGYNSYFDWYILVLAFNLIACLPYTKMAHLVYRTVALTYVAYVEGRSQTTPYRSLPSI